MGVKTVSGRFQVVFQEAVVPLKHLQRFVPGNLHDRQVIDARPSHVRHGCMPDVMKAEPLDLGSPTRRIERRLNGVDRFAVH